MTLINWVFNEIWNPSLFSVIIMRKYLMLLLALFFIGSMNAQTKPDSMNIFDFEKAWKEVSSFESKDLPESALKVVEEIYEQANKEGNTGQLVKAVVHQLKFLDYKEENGFARNLKRLKVEADHASFPAKPLLHSMLAEMYWQYYQGNRHKFLNRSETVNVPEDDEYSGDIETWSLPKIVQETFAQYRLSLQNSDRSKAELVEVLNPVLEQGNPLGRKFRPTLYDFLAHRALDSFASHEPEISKSAYAFVLDKAEYMAETHDFVQLKLESRDSLSMKFFALHILQDLLNFHIHEQDPSAFVDIELKRLQFVRTNLTLPNKNELYLQALGQLEKKLIKHPVSGKISLEKAKVFVETAALYEPLQKDDPFQTDEPLQQGTRQPKDNHQWDLKTAYQLCQKAIDRFPDSEAAISCRNLQSDILKKSLTASVESSNIPGIPFRSLVQYKNFTDLYYRIIKVSREEIQSVRKKLQDEYSRDREKKFAATLLQKPH